MDVLAGKPPEPKPKISALAQVETSVCGLVLNTLEDMTTVAQIILQSKIAPDSFKTKEQIFVGLQTGAEIGLKPMQALNSIVVIHGKPTLWGDAALALVKRSGLLHKYTETVVGEGDNMSAGVQSVRDAGEGRECIVTTTFTVADAKTAGLWKKKGPWTTHPKRMLKYKARAFNLRDNFPDVLFGMHLTEEMMGEEPLSAPKSDVLPRDGRRLPVAEASGDKDESPQALSGAGNTAPDKPETETTFVDTTRAPVVEAGDITVTETEIKAEVKKPDPDAEVRAKEANEPQEKPEPESELVTFVCKECGQTFQYGKEEGKGVPCSCGKGLLVEAEKQPEPVEEEKPEPSGNEDKKTPELHEPVSDEDWKAQLYIEVNGMYVTQGGKDFIEFAAFVLCLDDSEIAPSKLTEEQLKQIKAYIETSGVAIN
ncbi:hypothetical protein LCGC14_1302750 [marine sediment metagenome]|uniref:Uncharacterized protein n=1 Tax=marine sediment metagenome TaxID=412755 RepID=A0A0F9NS18_9ZZZZ